MKNKKEKRILILKGEGINEHAIYGDVAEIKTDYEEKIYDVKNDSLLIHENPSVKKKTAEHFPIIIEKGKFVRGTQIEFNPITQRISGIWD